VSLLTNIDQSKVIEFLQDRSARIKGSNGTFIFTLGKETLQPNLLNRLEEVVDCVIELDINKSREKTIRKLCIKKMRGRKASDKWILFDINPEKGIIFHP
jgi:archaellum biogenesis ATPase FlaH